MMGNKIIVSKTAIRENIQKLREEGYIIDTLPEKGYSLEGATDLLLPAEIQDGLETGIFGKNEIVHFRVTDSTNVRAREMAEKGFPEGTVVIAEDQSKGRGRKGRSWHSQEGMGICMSIILRPAFPPGEAACITLITAVAEARALLSLFKLNIRIKWPNDILLKGKKLSGILTEMDADKDIINYIIVGVGINVNTPAESVPDELRDIATSILIETGKEFPRIRIVRAFLEYFEHYYRLFNDRGFEPILDEWKHLSGIIGQNIRVDMVNNSFTGKVIDVDKGGFLVLQDTEGGIHTIVSGDVSYI